MRRCTRCAIVAGLVALLLGLLFLPLMKGGVDASLQDEAKAALAARGLSEVEASSDWAALTLTGPESARSAALAAAAGMPNADAVDTVTYVVGGTGGPAGPAASSSATATTSPSAGASSSTSAAVRASVTAEVSGAADPRAVELTGSVATEEQHAALLSAATTAFGGDHVTDRITVQAGAPNPADSAALTQFGALLTAFGPAVATGRIELATGALTVSGTGKDAARTTAADAAVKAATAAGVTVTGGVTAPSGAAAGTTAAEVQRQLTAALGAGVLFDTGSAQVTPTATAVLDKVAAVLTAAGDLKVTIAGHTDNQGPAPENLTLSRERAESVKAYLVAHGVAATRLTTTGFGDTRPRTGNATAAERLANRRIELTVQGS